jgi:hypothetical protein
MTELKLTNNQLVGSVPSTIGQMSNLGKLDGIYAEVEMLSWCLQMSHDLYFSFETF